MTATLAILGLSVPARAAPHGSFVALTSAGLPAGGDVSQVAINANGELFATVYGDGVYRSTDGGETFIKLAPPNFGMTNDIPNKEMMTMIVNDLGEPIIGSREVGAQPGQYLFRLDWANRTWVAASIPTGRDIGTDGYDPTGSQTITIGGVAIPKQRRFPRHMTLDKNGVLWLGWAYIPGFLRSFDHGSTYQFTAVPVATVGPYAGTGPGNLYSFNYNPVTGEYFYGTELIGFWHSTDGGNTWLPLDPAATTAIGRTQNDYSIGFNKDQEPIFANWGRSAAVPAGGDVFTVLGRYGVVISASTGLKPWQFNKQNVFYQYNGGDAIMRNLRVASVGYNFISGYSSNYYDNSVPGGGKQTVYLSRDGLSWEEADVNQPFVSPYCNAICTDGTDVFVGGTGKVWKFVINEPNHLPQITLSTPPGPSSFGTPIAVSGSATDLDGDPLDYHWAARGPGQAVFADEHATSTTVSFSTPGDYVLTFTADDGNRSASSGMIVQIINHAPTVATPASATVAGPSIVDLSVLGADLANEGGEAGLTYTWFATTAPTMATVTFDQGGTNAAKNARATVNKTGTYTFTVVIQDGGGLVTTSQITITVAQAVTSVLLSPTFQIIANDQSLSFAAIANDQFGVTINPQPTWTWSVSGGGSIDAQGLFTADGVSTGSFTVTAAAGGVQQTATVVTVRNEPPVFTATPVALPSTVTLPGTTELVAEAIDPDDFPGMDVTYTWSKVSGPGVVTFTPNGTDPTATTAAFSAPGIYQLQIVASDTISSVQSIVTVVVNPDPTVPITISFQDGVNGYSGEVDLSISTQYQAAWNFNNGNTVRSSPIYVQDTAASGGFVAKSLLRFGNLDLPPGSKVLSADLTLNFNTYSAGYAVTGRYLGAFFNQAAPQYHIGWLERDQGQLWNTPGASGEGSDVLTGSSFSIDGFSLGNNQAKTVSLDPAIVRGWVETPSTNNGIILLGNAGKSGTLTSSFDATIAKRPKLTVVYTAAIAQTATASPQVVTGFNTALHVLGTDFPDEGGESSLTYTWSVAPGSPNAPVIFSQNGNNAAKDTVATFSKIGFYGMRVTITDRNGISVTSGVDVQVVATPSLITIAPANPTVAQTQPISFSAAVIDQFGAAIMPPPIFTWAVSGGGTIDASGIFTPDGVSTGLFEVSATLDGHSSSTYVTVVHNEPPSIASTVATPSTVALPNGTTLTATASDPDGFPGNGLVYTWSLGSGPAAVTFTPNASASAATTQVAFTAAGTYTLHLVVSDGITTSASDVTVTVQPDPATPVTVSFQQGANGYAGGVDVTITTQSRASWNNFNGNLFKGSILYVQDTSSAQSGFIGKGLVRFNNLGLPTGAIVTSATLTLTFATYSPNFSAVGRYLLASWDPNAPQYKLGWVNRDATHLWAVQGAAGEGSDLVANSSFAISTAITGANQVKTANLDTAVVQTWVTNPTANQGILLMSAAGVSSQFSSATDPTVAKRPKLVITYHL
ncbi:MAG: DNRLRE domain-containing protein [Byssovorax sp.]